MPFITTPNCPGCGTHEVIEVTEAQAIEWKKPRGVRQPVQVVFPTLTVDQRERLITGLCGPCWDRTIGDEDDKL